MGVSKSRDGIHRHFSIVFSPCLAVRRASHTSLELYLVFVWLREMTDSTSQYDDDDESFTIYLRAEYELSQHAET